MSAGGLEPQEVLVGELVEEAPRGLTMPPGPMERSTRRHVATAGRFGYALERDDVAQPLRTYTPEATRAQAAAVLLWLRVGLAAAGAVVGVLTIGVAGVLVVHALAWAVAL